MTVKITVHSSHGTYVCDREGNVLEERLCPGSGHAPGSRLRFEWPSSVSGDVDILACTEYLANGDVVPPDEEWVSECMMNSPLVAGSIYETRAANGPQGLERGQL